MVWKTFTIVSAKNSRVFAVDKEPMLLSSDRGRNTLPLPLSVDRDKVFTRYQDDSQKIRYLLSGHSKKSVEIRSRRTWKAIRGKFIQAGQDCQVPESSTA